MAATTRATGNEDPVRRFAQAVVNEGDDGRIAERRVQPDVVGRLGVSELLAAAVGGDG